MLRHFPDSSLLLALAHGASTSLPLLTILKAAFVCFLFGLPVLVVKIAARSPGSGACRGPAPLAGDHACCKASNRRAGRRALLRIGHRASAERRNSHQCTG